MRGPQVFLALLISPWHPHLHFILVLVPRDEGFPIEDAQGWSPGVSPSLSHDLYVPVYTGTPFLTNLGRLGMGSSKSAQP